MLVPQLAALLYGLTATVGLFVFALYVNDFGAATVALASCGVSYVAQSMLNEDDDLVQSAALYLWALAIVAWLIAFTMLLI